MDAKIVLKESGMETAIVQNLKKIFIALDNNTHEIDHQTLSVNIENFILQPDRQYSFQGDNTVVIFSDLIAYVDFKKSNSHAANFDFEKNNLD